MCFSANLLDCAVNLFADAGDVPLLHDEFNPDSTVPLTRLTLPDQHFQ